MTKNIVIIGAGGVGREVHEVLEAINDDSFDRGISPRFNFLGFLDDAPTGGAIVEERGTILGTIRDLDSLPADTLYVIAIGDGGARRKIDAEASRLGFEAAVLMHPAASVGRYRNAFEPGVVVCANASITTNVHLGRHVQVHVNATVGHDTTIGAYSSLYPGSNVSGNVSIGTCVTFGTGSQIIQGLSVGDNTTVGAGAVVVKNIESNVVVVGSPARPLKR